MYCVERKTPRASDSRKTRGSTSPATGSTAEILGARVVAMRGSEGFHDRAPNAVLDVGVRRGRDRRTGFISQRDLRDRVAARTILLVPEAGMVRIELDDGVAIEGEVVAVGADHAHVDVVE